MTMGLKFRIALSSTPLSVPRIALFLLACAILCPIRFWTNYPDVDSAWLYGLNYAADHGLIPGRDVLSTTGPLAYLAFPMDVGDNLRKALAVQFLLWLFVGVVLVDVYLRSGIRLRNLVVFTGLLALSAPLFWFNRVGLDNLLLATSLVCVVMYRWRGGLWRLVLGQLLIGFMAQIKFTSAFIAAGAMAGFLAERFLRERWRAWREAVIILVVPAVVLLICFSLTMPLASIPQFVKTSSEVSSGYSIAMSFPNPPVQFYGALLAIACVGAYIAIHVRGGEVPALFYAAILLMPLLVSLKHGFVRQDQHIVSLFCFATLALALISLTLHFRGWRQWIALGINGVVIALWLAFTPPFLGGVRNGLLTVSGLGGVRLAWRARNLDRVKSDLSQHTENHSRESLRVEPEFLPVIRDSSVGFLSPIWHYPVALGDVKKLALFPSTFPSAAYTAHLDSLSADWVKSGPQFLLFDGNTVDLRHPWAELPATWLEVYRWYDAYGLGKYNLLLQRRSTPRFTRLVSLGTAKTSLAHGFALPEVHGVSFWTMRCPLSRAGRFNAAILRVPPLMMDVTYRDGAVQAFRAIPTQTVAPVIASMPADLAAFARIFDSSAPPEPAAARIDFGKSAFSRWVEAGAALDSFESCEVEFFRPEL